MGNLHSKGKNRYEYRAKNTLLEFFPNEFNNLQKSEKPDWIDINRGVGVEVVRATNETFQKDKDHIEKKIAGNDLEKLSPKEQRSIGRCKGNIYTTRDLGFSRINTIASYCYAYYTGEVKEMLKETIMNKIRRINSGRENYQSLQFIALYVVCDAEICYIEPLEVFDSIRVAQQECKNKFAELFVDDGVDLYRYCFSDGSAAINKFSSENVKNIFVKTEQEIRQRR